MVDPAIAPPVPSASPGARRLAILVWLVACASAVVGLGVWVGAGLAPLELRFGTPAAYLALVAATFTQATAGLVLRLRRPDLSLGWLILAFALSVGIAGLSIGLVPTVRPDAPGSMVLIVWLLPAVGFAGGTVTAQLLGLLFPTGRLISPVWWWAVVLAIVGAAAFAIGLLVTPGPLWLFPAIENPVVSGPVPEAMRLFRDSIAPLLAGIASVAVAVAFGVRYRLAEDVERLQIRWYVISGIGLVVMALAYLVAMAVLPARHAVGEAITVVFYLSTALPPLAIAFGILRYRLYQIDRIVNRAVVLGVLTALLAGLYAASIRLFNAIFVALTGESSEAALVLTTLVLAATFTPLKGRLEKMAGRWSHAAPDATAVDADAPATPIEPAELERLVESTVRRVLAERTGATDGPGRAPRTRRR